VHNTLKAEGNILEGEGVVNGAALAIHTQVHDARPDIEAAGKPVLIDKDSAKLTSEQMGNSEVGWFQFQPLWERIKKRTA
ncbi:hypothetical protein ACBQ08_25955, partial [Aneurinibacillus aneurinilyticus]